jgi:hypothetical protein
MSWRVRFPACTNSGKPVLRGLSRLDAVNRTNALALFPPLGGHAGVGERLRISGASVLDKDDMLVDRITRES